MNLKPTEIIKKGIIKDILDSSNQLQQNGVDLTNKYTITIPANKYRNVRFNETFDMQDTIGFIKIRSSFSRKGIFLSCGFFDSGYEGVGSVSLYNFSGAPIEIPANTRIAQMVVLPASYDKLYDGHYKNNPNVDSKFIHETKKDLPDVQNEKDNRHKVIDKVGIRKVFLPLNIYFEKNTTFQTIGEFSIYSSLRKDVKGHSMSRFYEILYEVNSIHFSVYMIRQVLDEIRKRLGGDDTYIKVKFKYFIKETSPVSKRDGIVHLDCVLEGRDLDGKIEYYLTVNVPYTSCCPCSKEICDSGAHNQRSIATITVRLNNDLNLNKYANIKYIYDMVSKIGSSKIYPLLKREDEKFVVEEAYNNPQFVEDMARDISIMLDTDLDDNILDYVVVINHEESIHQHNAVAVLNAGRVLQ